MAAYFRLTIDVAPRSVPQAVDLYVLERAFISTHEDSEPLVAEVLRTYKVCFERTVQMYTLCMCMQPLMQYRTQSLM